MKKAVIVSLMLSVGVLYSVSSGETIYFPDIPGSGFELLEQNEYGVRVKYSINELFMDDLVVDGQTMKTIQVPGIFLPNNEGAPNLPGLGRMIAVPQGSVARLRVEEYKTESISGIDIAPAPQIPFDTDDSPPKYIKDESIYSANQNYPAQAVLISDPAKLRGVDYVILGITPFQYNPVTRDLIIFKETVISVDFVGGNGHFGENRLRSRFWEPILSANLLNYYTLPKIDFSQLDPNPSETDDFEYVIIVPDDPDFIAWADTIKQWRTLQGIRTGVVNLTDIGGNTTTAIETYINTAYNTWDIPPVSVLLLSDYQNSGLSYGITSPYWDNYCVSDNIYGDIDGDDLPEIAMARITAQNGPHLANMIGKFLNYERNPPTSANFYDQPITAGGWQTERWFIICTEICWGFMHNVLGKNPVREYAIYSGTPGTVWSTNQNTYMLVDYFGPNGLGYIPATPAHLTDWGANATRLNNDINSGAFLLLHRDHGGETGWGEPDYQISDLTGLNNTMHPHVFSINCLTGRYDYSSEVFAEAFHRMNNQPYGALSVTAASEVSYSFVNDTYIFGIWDYMWPDFDPGHGNPGNITLNPCFANASAKHYLQASSWPYNPQHKVITHHLFHHHGDAFTTIYSEIPQTQTVVHDPVLHAGPNFFSVTAQPGAIVGLTVNGEIIGVGVGTGSPESIPIEPQVPGSNMIVTVTLPNYYRYDATVPIITTTGAYVIYDSCVVDDASGNGNGIIEFGESISLGVRLENVGSDTAYGVTAKIRTADSYVTMTDSTEYYGDIANGETSYIAGAYGFDVSIDVPDDHNINFVVEIRDTNDSVWTSYFNLTAYTPELAFVEVLVDDATGNGNGILEAGETANLIITLENTGGSDAIAVAGLLSENDDLVDITDADGSFGNILGGGTGDNSADPFVVVGDTALPMGHSIYFDLDLTAAGGYSTSTQFILKTVQTFEYDDGRLRATNDWEWGTPQNYGPPSAYSGTKCWGTVIDGYRTAGYNAPNGFIYSNLNFDLDIATNASISFYHWYYTSSSTYDSINVKINNGSGWQLLYTNYGESAGWELLEIDLSSFSGLAEISLEYFSRSSIDERPGWYIDDLALLGCSMWFPDHDIVVQEFVSPFGSGIINDPFTPEVIFENNGANDETDVPVRLLIDPGAYNDPQIIPAFNSGANISQQFTDFTPTVGGVYTLTAISELAGDEDPSSDTLVMLFTAYDDVLNFETDNGGLAGDGDWEWGTPTNVGPPGAHSGDKCWGTDLDDYRTNGNGSWLYSNLTFQLDLGMDNDATIAFWHWYHASGVSYDSLTFKINDGGGWITLMDWYSGPTDDWEEVVVDLSSYVGMIDINFQYASRSSIVDRPGWYIDDLALSSCLIVAPEIEVTPMAISGEASSGSSDADTLTISNTGDGTLNYIINCISNPTVTRNSGRLETLYDTGDFKVERLLAGYHPVEDKLKVENLAENAKGEPYFLPVPLSIGGPDAYGYTWIDSDEPGGPTYEWIDISSVGVPIPLSDDDNEGPFPLGFTVDYYGVLFSQVYVCSNGWISFTSTSTSLSNTTLPSTNEPNNTLSIFWDDLNPASAGMVYYYADTANDRFIVSYDGVPHFSNDGSLYFQVIINADGSILYQYNTMNHGGHAVSASIGTENYDGSIGLEYDYNSNPPAIHDNLAILFLPPTFWLYSDVNSGSIPPGGGPDLVEITMDALELLPGVYTGSVRILSNDPDESIINVPVTFTVGGCVYVVGDVNGDDVYNGFDITYGVAYFKGGPDPLCDSCDCPPNSFFWTCGDVNADCMYNGLDISYGVLYFKYGLVEPIPCPDCPPPLAPAREIKKTESLDVIKGKTKSQKGFERR